MFDAINLRRERMSFLAQCDMPLLQRLNSTNTDKDPKSPESLGLRFSMPKDDMPNDPEHTYQVVAIDLAAFQRIRRENKHIHTEYHEPSPTIKGAGSTARVFRNLVYSGGNMELPVVNFDENDDPHVVMGNHRIQIMESVYGFNTIPVCIRGEENAQRLFDEIGSAGQFFEKGPFGSVVYRNRDGTAQYGHDTTAVNVVDRNYDALRQEAVRPAPGTSFELPNDNITNRYLSREQEV